MFRRNQSEPATLQMAAGLVHAAKRVVVLTGAGISTPSGIPDFRSANDGLWSQVDPMYVASIWSFHEKPERFYKWMRPLAKRIVEAKPNPAHKALVEIERLGKLDTLITQNIDGLHQQAGANKVIELHGHVRTVSCLNCGFTADAPPFLTSFVYQNQLPVCPDCRATLKPAVVLYGEPLPENAITAAQEAALRCDLMLVAGSSLKVMPAADLPALAVRGGAKLILANIGMTPCDHLADVHLKGDVAEILPLLVHAVKALRY